MNDNRSGFKSTFIIWCWEFCSHISSFTSDILMNQFCTDTGHVHWNIIWWSLSKDIFKWTAGGCNHMCLSSFKKCCTLSVFIFITGADSFVIFNKIFSIFEMLQLSTYHWLTQCNWSIGLLEKLEIFVTVFFPTLNTTVNHTYLSCNALNIACGYHTNTSYTKNVIIHKLK